MRTEKEGSADKQAVQLASSLKDVISEVSLGGSRISKG